MGSFKPKTIKEKRLVNYNKLKSMEEIRKYMSRKLDLNQGDFERFIKISENIDHKARINQYVKDEEGENRREIREVVQYIQSYKRVNHELLLTMNRQKQILNVFNQDKDLVLKKSDIIEKGSLHYYANTSKHVGDVLFRMVKKGLLERVKKGFYKLGKPKGEVKFIEDPDQTKLF